MKKCSVLIITCLLVLGLLCTGFGKRHDSASPKLGANNPVDRGKVAGLLENGGAVGVVLLEKDRVTHLLQEGVPSFILSPESGQTPNTAVVILCPGHSDYVKNSIQSLRNGSNWTELE